MTIRDEEAELLDEGQGEAGKSKRIVRSRFLASLCWEISSGAQTTCLIPRTGRVMRIKGDTDSSAVGEEK